MVIGRTLQKALENFFKSPVVQDARCQVLLPNGEFYDLTGAKLLENKIIVSKGEIITSEILEKKDFDYKNINSQIKNLLRKTRDKIKSRGSIANEITTKGDFIKKIRESLKINQNNKYRLEVVSLKDSKTAESIIVELNIIEL